MKLATDDCGILIFHLSNIKGWNYNATVGKNP
jgi:hypothetical protein